MVPNKQILFQDIHGRILADGCQMYPEQYQNYDFHKESRFIYVLNNHDYFYKNINDKDTLVRIEKPLPVLYHQKDECCGCGACYSVCPRTDQKNVIRNDESGKTLQFMYQQTRKGKVALYPHTGAITMLPDEDGFLYPVIDAQICIRCYRCLSVCDFKTR